jgi:hypothetical protein
MLKRGIHFGYQAFEPLAISGGNACVRMDWGADP